jgi:putative pyruvate formate lyase activating enzyme
MNEVFKIGSEAVVMDPSIEAIPFLKNADANFAIHSIRPSGKFIPRFQTAKDSGLLEKKAHESLAMLYECELCARRCKANRFREKGKCGLGDKTFYERPFIHVAEEPVINPSLVINFTGCNMSCVHCVRQVQTKKEIHSETAEAFWNQIARTISSYPEVCSLEFAGGDPNPYIPWILTCLKYLPDSISLPLIWNSNLYVSEKGMSLLDGIIDVYLPDFAFGNDACAQRLAGVDGYMAAAIKGIELMIAQKANVIVRILVLPGHVDCCHKKAIDILSRYRNSIFISILDQYVPVHLASKYPDIYRRPKKEEIQAIEEYATRKGLRNVMDANDFWTRLP